VASPDPTSLDRLHDIVIPSAAPWWPPAPAWYWVLGFFSVVAVVALLLAFHRRQRSRYRREALTELLRLESALEDRATRSAALRALAELLKRAAVTAFPREQVAGLSGPAWFEFLDRTGRTTRFSAGDGAVLDAAVYDKRTAAALDDPKITDLISLVRRWLKHHRAEAVTGGGR
jgi:hypothetical protein